MKKYLYLDRFLQIAVLLIMVTLMWGVTLEQQEDYGKRTESAGMEETRNRCNALHERLCAKRIQERRKETVSFGALYGLDEYDVPEKRLDFDALRRDDNSHIYAWITIPDTVIDYPVLQHPDQPDYYLTHNLDGSTGYPGCIYTQPANNKDWSDNHTVIYGHNMRNGTMFAALHHYEEKEFLEENPYVYIYTENSVRVYRIFAAYSFSDEHLLLNYNTGTQTGYKEYLRLIEETASDRGYYLSEAAPRTGEPIITLSTCIADRPAQRYLVQAVLEAEGVKTQ